MGQEHYFAWRILHEGAARIEHPALRQPVSLIVDDAAPGYNPAHFHSGFRLGPLHIPPTVIDHFADLVEASGIRGKFSVIPYPFGLGRLDRDVEGVPHQDLQHFLEVVRTRIAPAMDITPEVLTHWNALDLPTEKLLPLWEHVWSRTQTAASLRPYLTLALEILDAVGLPCSGMTSPWNFGAGVEDDYAEALLAAQQALYGRGLTWYFLHADPAARHVQPRLQVNRPQRREAVVSIVCCDAVDFGQPLWRGEDPLVDALLTADGEGGRLAQVVRAGGPIVFHTHWQSIFGFGTARGLDGLRTIAERIATHYGHQVGWLGCAALAEYTAAAAATTLEPVAQDGNTGDAARQWRVRTPFPCRTFTLSLAHAAPSQAVQVQVDGTPLARAATPSDLREGRYLLHEGRLHLCWHLNDDQLLTVHSGAAG